MNGFVVSFVPPQANAILARGCHSQGKPERVTLGANE